MRLTNNVHLTYCTNIHAGETWDEVRSALEEHLPAVKAKVSPDAPFGLGLRLSARAAEDLEEPKAREALVDFLVEHGLYVFTLNGFPYGAFHGTRVKEKVYAPDWRDPRRAEYTRSLARLLAALLPEGMEGSISTVPVGYRPDFRNKDALVAAGAALRHQAVELARIYADTGRMVALAVEPEPFCALETVEEAAGFLEDHVFRPIDGTVAEEVARRHIGVCLDTCHEAVAFEEPGAATVLLQQRGIAVPKVQASAALRIPAVDDTARAALRAFADDVYLHQVVERSPRGLRHFVDLPEAVAAPSRPDAEWRIHFHVPVWAESLGAFGSTQAELADLLALQRAAPVSRHLEVETYTWSVLPDALRGESVDADIAKELVWVRDRLT